MAVRDQSPAQSRARVLYRLPEQRRFGAGGLPGALTMLALALVLFLGGLVVGRATTTRGQSAAAPPATGAQAPTAQAPAASTAPAPSAATTASPATAGAAASGRVGPRRVVHGVGVGYARTPEGAVAGAANYTRVLSSALILDEARRRQAIATLAAPEARARLQQTFDQAVASIRQGLGVTGDGTQVLLRATPVGWRIEQYGAAGPERGQAGSARVAIWVTSVGGSVGGSQGSVPVREVWGTTTVQLRWAGGDWKVLDFTTTDGPVPIADVSPPTAAGELVTTANEFKEFTYAPGP